MATRHIVYHLHAVNDYADRFERTYQRISNSGLIDQIAMIHIVADGGDPRLFADKPKVTLIPYDYRKALWHLMGYGQFDRAWKVWRRRPRMVSEYPALCRLLHLARQGDGATLYLHCKGVTKPDHPYVGDWIEMMEYFLIDQHQRCFERLATGHRVVGCNFLTEPAPHFSGNFWWADHGYLRRRTMPHPSRRMECETWICADPAANPASLHDSGINHYEAPYPPARYRSPV